MIVPKVLKDEFDVVENVSKEVDKYIHAGLNDVTHALNQVDTLIEYYRTVVKDPSLDSTLTKSVSRMIAVHSAEKARIQAALNSLEESANVFKTMMKMVQEQRAANAAYPDTSRITEMLNDILKAPPPRDPGDGNVNN